MIGHLHLVWQMRMLLILMGLNFLLLLLNVLGWMFKIIFIIFILKILIFFKKRESIQSLEEFLKEWILLVVNI